MPTIAAGQSQTVTVVQNTRLDLVGSGVVTFGPGPLNGQSQSIVNSGSVGPFDERDQVVYVSAGVAQISYIVFPTNTSAVVADQAANLYANGALVSGAGNFDATDTGTDWLAAPSVLSYTATLTAGTSTTVLIEVRDPALTVSTAQIIVADTTSEVLRGSVLLSGASQYRVRRSSGTGTVSFLIQG